MSGIECVCGRSVVPSDTSIGVSASSFPIYSDQSASISSIRCALCVLE